MDTPLLRAPSARIIPGLVTLMLCSMGVFAPSAVAADPGPDLLGIDMAKWMNDDLNRSLSPVEQLKAKWVRCGIAWKQIEPSPGKYDWEHLDRVVNQTKQHNLHLLVTLRAFNPWAGIRIPEKQNQAQAQRAATPPKDMAQFARFVKAVAARYKGRGVCWQIENEPNLDVHWPGSGLIRFSNPGRLMPSTCTTISSPKKGIPAPLWITEFDFPSGPLTVRQKTVSFAPDQQARFLEQAVSRAKAEGVQHVFWMFMRDTERGQGNHLGLAAMDGRRKKAWNEFVHVASD